MGILEKRNVFGALILLILGTLWHFGFEMFGKSSSIAPFFPVNESVWEHMKLVFWPMLLLVAIESLRWGRQEASFWPSSLVGILAATALVPILYYTYVGILGHHTLVGDILVFVIAVLAGYRIRYALQSANYTSSIYFWWGLLTLFAVAFVIFSFMPPELPIFTDPVTGTKGVIRS